MSPDIMAGPSGLAGAAPNGHVGGATTATGPPGLTALFAALLAKSGNPQTNIIPSSVATKTEPPANASLPILPTPLPIKNQSKNQILTTPTTPPNAGVPAKTQTKTQNAMDTVPVTVSPKAKRAESKPGGELPLPEARTTTSAPLPVFPGLLILTSATAPSATVMLPSKPALKSQTAAGVVTPQSPLTAALPQTVAPQLRVFSLAAPARETSAPAVETAATKAQNQPSLFKSPSEVLVREGGLRAFVAATSVARPELTTTASVVKAQGFTVLVTALAEPIQPEAVAAQDISVVPLPSLALTLKAAPVVKAAPLVSAQTTVKMPLTQAIKTSQQAALAAGTVLAEQPHRALMPGLQPVTAGKAAVTPLTTQAAAPAIIETAVAVVPATKTGRVSENNTVSPIFPTTREVVAPAKGTTGPVENSLKTQPAPADNNARVQAKPAVKMPPMELRLQVVGKRSERRVMSENGESASAIPTQTTVAPTNAAKPAAVPLTHAERAQLVRQAADSIEALRLPAKPGATQQMTLQLHPKDWGQIQISVRVVSVSQADAAPNAAQTTAQTQTVTAHVIAETPQVKAALENGAGELRHALREAGLHLDRLTVTVQSAGASGQAGMTPGHHQPNSGGSGGFGQSMADQKTGGSGPNTGALSFAAFAGSSGGRHGSQPQPAYAGPYTEPERDEPREWDTRQMPRQPGIGGIDMQA